MGFAPAGVLPSSSQDSKVAADGRNVSMPRRVNVDGAPGVQMYSRNVARCVVLPPSHPHQFDRDRVQAVRGLQLRRSSMCITSGVKVVTTTDEQPAVCNTSTSSSRPRVAEHK